MENRDVCPQTPEEVRNASIQSPPVTPPRLQNHPSSQEFDERDNRALVAPLHNSLVLQHEHSDDIIENTSSPILDFPLMIGGGQGTGASADGGAASNISMVNEQNSFESPPAPFVPISASPWNINAPISPTARRVRRRTRSSSFDGTMPVPRITLRPRFTSHLQYNHQNYSARYAPTSSTTSTSTTGIGLGPLEESLGFSQQLESFIRHNSSSSNLSRGSGDTPPTSNRPRGHFRSHTYNGPDNRQASSDIFALAMQQEQFLETSAPTLPVVHTPLDLSSLSINLPPATQTFLAPRDGQGSSGAVIHQESRNLNRPIPRKPTGTGSVVPNSTTGSMTGRPGSGGATGTTTGVKSPFLTSPSQGTATCTLSTSSATSAFDHTTSLSPNWHQSPGDGSIVFEQLQKREERGEESLSEFEDDDNNDHDDQIDERSKHQSTSLPFDEVQFLVEDPSEDKKPCASGGTSGTNSNTKGP